MVPPAPTRPWTDPTSPGRSKSVVTLVKSMYFPLPSVPHPGPTIKPISLGGGTPNTALEQSRQSRHPSYMNSLPRVSLRHQGPSAFHSDFASELSHTPPPIPSKSWPSPRKERGAPASSIPAICACDAGLTTSVLAVTWSFQIHFQRDRQGSRQKSGLAP